MPKKKSFDAIVHGDQDCKFRGDCFEPELRAAVSYFEAGR